MKGAIFSLLAMIAVILNASTATPISSSEDGAMDLVRVSRDAGGMYCGDVSFSKCDGKYNRKLKCCKNSDKCDNWGGCKCASTHCCSGKTVKPKDDDHHQEVESSNPENYRHCGDADVRSDKCGGHFKRGIKCCKHSRKCKGYATLKCSSSHCCAGKVAGNNDDSRDCNGLCHLKPKNPHPDQKPAETTEQVPKPVLVSTPPLPPTEQLPTPTESLIVIKPVVTGPITNATQTSDSSETKVVKQKYADRKFNKQTEAIETPLKQKQQAQKSGAHGFKAKYNQQKLDTSSTGSAEKPKGKQPESSDKQKAKYQHKMAGTTSPNHNQTHSSSSASIDHPNGTPSPSPSPSPSPTSSVSPSNSSLIDDLKNMVVGTYNGIVHNMTEAAGDVLSNISMTDTFERAVAASLEKGQRILNTTSTLKPLDIGNATTHSILPRFPTENSTVCERRFQYKDAAGRDACCKGNGEITLANQVPPMCCIYPMRRSETHPYLCEKDTLPQATCDALNHISIAGKAVNASNLAACQGFQREAVVRNNRTTIEKVMPFKDGGCPHEGDALEYDYESGMFAKYCCVASRMYSRENINVAWHGPELMTEHLCCQMELTSDGKCNDGNLGFFERLDNVAVNGIENVIDLVKHHFSDTISPIFHALMSGGDVMAAIENGPAKDVLSEFGAVEATDIIGQLVTFIQNVAVADGNMHLQ